ncbi:5499_t:CDS:2 [Ambispora leptoticha]|uniref:RING-type E3 ubiquitin transferase n=1 Tax=Ambispora leptoticha TaxID=144679 RepID=A0A9N8Z570_9GLOM|nr:5499_t:CDS:2 [Ambispora leptoticha]
MNESWKILGAEDFDGLPEISQANSAENSDENYDFYIKKEKKSNNETVEIAEQTLANTLEVESEPRPSSKYSLRQRHVEGVSKLKRSLDTFNNKSTSCSGTSASTTGGAMSSCLISGIPTKECSDTSDIKENASTEIKEDPFASETSSSIGEGSSNQKADEFYLFEQFQYDSWPCLHQWVEIQSQNPLCPVCKAGCGKDKVIPIYGRGREAKDPRIHSDIPNRPAGQRPQPRRDPNSTGSPFFPGLHSTTAFNPHFSVTSGVSLFPSFFGAEFVSSFPIVTFLAQ